MSDVESDFSKTSSDSDISEADDHGSGSASKSKKVHRERARKRPVYNRGASDDDDEEDEDDDEELDEETRKFIVDDEGGEDGEDDENGAGTEDDEGRKERRKKKKRKHMIDSEESELDEDDMDLIEENTGVSLKQDRQFKRLKRKKVEDLDNEYDSSHSGVRGTDERRKLGGKSVRSRPSDDRLEDLFAEDEEDVQKREQVNKRQLDSRQESSEDERFDEDDLNDFIEYDGEEDDEDARDRSSDRRARGAASRQQRLKQSAAQNRLAAANLASQTGISEAAFQDLYDLFGDGTDYAYALEEEADATDGPERVENGYNYYSKAPQVTSLSDVFEPSVVAEKMLTEQDEVIRIQDVPERLQLRSLGVRAPDPGELDEEASWVAKEILPHLVSPSQSYPHLLQSIHSVLKFLREELFEVPFIHWHRQDFFHNVLFLEDLWRVYDLDEQFQAFYIKRKNCLELIQGMRLDDDYVTECVEKAARLEDVNDVHEYIQFRYAAKLDEYRESQQSRSKYKRPTRRDLYGACVKNGTIRLVKDVGISAREFGVNLVENTKRHFSEDLEQEPSVQAEQYVCREVANPNTLLDTIRTLIAKEMAHDPQIRSVLRRQYLKYSVVNTTPTERGIVTIDQAHPYFSFKYLTRKPVSEFKDAQFLGISQAESERLLDMNIFLPNEESFFRDASELYKSDNYSEVAEKWNHFRIAVLHEAFRGELYAIMEAWTKEHLRAEAAKWVADSCQRWLHSRVNVAPYRTQDGHLPARVLAVTWGNTRGRQGYAAVCNQHGVLLDQTAIKGIGYPDGQAELSDFMDKHRPDLVVIGTYDVSSKKLFDQVAEISLRLFGSQKSVVFAYDEVARLFMTKGQQEFEGMEPDILYCISMCRTVLNPLMEYAMLGNDLKLLQYEPFQAYVPEALLDARLERAMLNVVNTTGMDINDALMYPHHAHIFQYVCGLGPRKVKSILSKLEATDGSLESRADLIRKRLVGKIVFINCSSFIRFSDEDGARLLFDVLDCTRIHPEDYELARKMAADALDVDDEDMDEDNPSLYVKELLEGNADKLNELILEDYAKELERRFNSPKTETLNQIKQELQHPYRDLREPFRELDTDTLFDVLTGETERSLYMNCMLSGTVFRVRDKVVVVQLDNGLEGYIGVNNMSSVPFTHPSDLFTQNQPVQCILCGLDRDRMMADVSTHQEDLAKHELGEFMPPVDRYFDRHMWTEECKKAQQTKTKEQVTNRVVKHPLFRNVNRVEALTLLATRPIGELIIRPSKLTDHLTITWKVAEGISAPGCSGTLCRSQLRRRHLLRQRLYNLLHRLSIIL
jgi:transcription elongation factor SPT6